jgi:hypothetical protein
MKPLQDTETHPYLLMRHAYSQFNMELHITRGKYADGSPEMDSLKTRRDLIDPEICSIGVT